MRRESSGKRIELSPRDIEIFVLLARYRYLRSNFLFAFVGGRHETRFKERLGALYHDGRYINRPAEQWQFAHARYSPAIYELDQRGADIMKQYGLAAGTSLRRAPVGESRQFSHALMICDTLASIELGVRAQGTARFIPPAEILRNAPDAARSAPQPFALPVRIAHTFARAGKTHTASFQLVPDAVFGVEYHHSDGSKRYRFFALEAERSNRVNATNLAQTSYLKKALAYRHIAASRMHETQLGLPNLMVLTVTPTRARIETMKALLMDITGGKGSGMFLFQDIPVLGEMFKAPPPFPQLFTTPWTRAGHADFWINQP